MSDWRNRFHWQQTNIKTGLHGLFSRSVRYFNLPVWIRAPGDVVQAALLFVQPTYKTNWVVTGTFPNRKRTFEVIWHDTLYLQVIVRMFATNDCGDAGWMFNIFNTEISQYRGIWKFGANVEIDIDFKPPPVTIELPDPVPGYIVHPTPNPNPPTPIMDDEEDEEQGVWESMSRVTYVAFDYPAYRCNSSFTHMKDLWVSLLRDVPQGRVRNMARRKAEQVEIAMTCGMHAGSTLWCRKWYVTWEQWVPY
jgi:hypothetical protein